MTLLHLDLRTMKFIDIRTSKFVTDEEFTFREIFIVEAILK